jgi:hypothetical protein
MAKKAKAAKQAPKTRSTKQFEAATVRPEKTKSRTPAPERRSFQFDKLGRVIAWTVPEEAYAGDINGHAAFVGGFEARVHQVTNGSSDEGIPQRFAPGKLQTAFEYGYNEAARQDSQDLRPRTLAGSSSKAAKR